MALRGALLPVIRHARRSETPMATLVHHRQQGRDHPGRQIGIRSLERRPTCRRLRPFGVSIEGAAPWGNAVLRAGCSRSLLTPYPLSMDDDLRQFEYRSRIKGAGYTRPLSAGGVCRVGVGAHRSRTTANPRLHSRPWLPGIGRTQVPRPFLRPIRGHDALSRRRTMPEKTSLARSPILRSPCAATAAAFRVPQGWNG